MALTFLLPCNLLSRLNDNMNERKEASVEDQCVLGAGVETAWKEAIEKGVDTQTQNSRQWLMQ